MFGKICVFEIVVALIFLSLILPLLVGFILKIKKEQGAYAGFWKRAAAGELDLIILVGTTISILVAIEKTKLMLNIIGSFYWDEVCIRGVWIFAVLFLIYFTVFESSRLQATIGKWALGIKVGDRDGNRISFGRALARTIVKLVFAAIVFEGFMMSGLTTARTIAKLAIAAVAFIEFLISGFTGKKQALHDMITGSLVVNKAGKTPEAQA